MVAPFDPPPPSLGDWLGLREDLQAVEALLQEVEPPLSALEDYWAASAELLSLITDVDAHIDDWRDRGPRDEDRAIYQRQRRRVVNLLATINQYPLPTEDE